MSETDIPFADSTFLTYAIPFAGSLLIAIGIGAGVVGAYAPVQQQFGLCDSPSITVYTEGETAELTAAEDGQNLSLERLDFEELTPAEQAAFEEGLTEPFGEGKVDGSFDNRQAFERGVLIRYEGATHYATFRSANQCTAVDPVLFPLGVAAILLGIVWILAPPMYRKLATVEKQGG